MEKRTLLAFLITVAVWGIWFMIIKPDDKKTDTTPQKNSETAQIDKKDKQSTKKDDVKTVTSSEKTVSKPIKILKKSEKIENKTINIETEKFNVQFSNKGGSITSIKLKERKNSDGSYLEVVVNKSLYKAKNNFDFPIHFSENEFMTGSEINDILWKHEKKSERNIVFYIDAALNDTPVQILKTFTFTDKGDGFTLEYKIINKGKKDITLEEKKIIFSPSDMLGPAIDYDNTYNKISGIYSKDGSFEQINKGSGFFSKEGIIKKEQGNIAYVGLMSRYLLLIMLPDNFTGSEVFADNRDNTGFRTGMVVNLDTIKADSEVVKNFKIYLGEKDKDRLRVISETIVDAADVSKWIEPIRYFVMWSLLGLNGLVGNVGWALVIFSILSKIVFMPLTMKSTESMRKMQSLTPKINELKAKHKDKPDVIQKETMKLYKENKVNPLGGCLPILLQMPFFFGLYSALVNSIDLWNAPFIFWIKDLSMPDTIMQISGYNVNILPVIMTLSTYAQQKMTAVDGGQQQKMMTMMMPIVFIFIFWSMPSGLVLYWTLQNGLQVAHQLFVNRKKKNDGIK